MRQHRPQSIWILDRTIRPALAAALAGIPERIGLELGPQSAFITNHGIGQDHFHDHSIDWLRALMAAMKVPLVSTEPDLQALTPVLSLIGEKFAQFARPWIAVGIGASHPDKDWPDATWCEFLAGYGPPAPSFWSEGQPITRARRNLSWRPVHVRSSMRATVTFTRSG